MISESTSTPDGVRPVDALVVEAGVLQELAVHDASEPLPLASVQVTLQMTKENVRML